MPKVILFILALSVMAASIFAADFRNAKWGMSFDEVKEVETAMFKERKQDRLVYEAYIAGLPMRISYYFKDDKFVLGRYDLVKSYRDSSVYNRSFDDLDRQLTRKYGDPKSSHTRCSDPFYAEYPSRWGTGIVVGKLRRQSAWHANSTSIRHSIGASPGGTVAHWIEYTKLEPSVLDDSYAELATAL